MTEALLPRVSHSGGCREPRLFRPAHPGDDPIAADAAVSAGRARCRTDRAADHPARGRTADQRADGRYRRAGQRPEGARRGGTGDQAAGSHRQADRRRRACLQPDAGRPGRRHRALQRRHQRGRRCAAGERQDPREHRQDSDRHPRAADRRPRHQRCGGGGADAVAKARGGGALDRQGPVRHRSEAAHRTRQGRQHRHQLHRRHRSRRKSASSRIRRSCRCSASRCSSSSARCATPTASSLPAACAMPA